MSKRSRVRNALGLTAVVAMLSLVPVPFAQSSGPATPVSAYTTMEGVIDSRGENRYLAVTSDDRTLVMKVAMGSGQPQTLRWVAGSWSVPAVTLYLNTDTSGIAADGSRLVLIDPSTGWPQGSTDLVVLDGRSLKVERRIRLDGAFSFDAISPDGSTAFLVEYTDPRDPTDYRLRVLDLDTAELEPGSLKPENNPDEEMRGSPTSRATSQDGRWAFTLYDGGRIYGFGSGKPGKPFVHAIDTVSRRTLCIDLDWDIDNRVLSKLQLRTSADGASVEVAVPGEEPLGRIDVATGEAIAASGEPAESSTAAEDSSLWPGLGIAAAAAAALGGVAVLRRRRA